MDELFERIKLLEEENKVLEKENSDLNFELQSKKNSELNRAWLSEKEEQELNNRKEIFQKKMNEYKELFEKSLNFPNSSDPNAPTEPATIKDPKFDELEILNFFKLISEEKKNLMDSRQKSLKKIEQMLGPYNPIDPSFNELIKEFEKTFKGRVINFNNSNYQIKSFNEREKNIRALLLYDPNGIKVDTNYHDKYFIYNNLELSDLFENSYILSKEESDIIMSDYRKDSKNFIKIFYQMQVDKYNPHEKELIPYKIEPSYIDINQYNLSINMNSIKSVQNKETFNFVVFDSVCIGDGKNTTGLVSSSLIKVYTTLYSKDILNILHIHLNDTSQEITIDSEFLEKDEQILNHKIFTVDAMGKRLTYKLLFKEYKLIKIYYAVGNDYIDEPPFQEIRISASNIVKILRGEYKNYYGKVKDFPIGMLARKDKGNDELKKMKSQGYQKEGYCGDRHLEELPGFVSVAVLYTGDMKEISGEINISIPVCYLSPLSPHEEVRFEKNIIENKEMEIEENDMAVDEIYNKCKEYEKFVKNDALLEEKSLAEIKDILAEVEKIEVEKYENNTSDEFKEKLMFVSDIKNQIQSLLIQKIRLFTLTGHK